MVSAYIPPIRVPIDESTIPHTRGLAAPPFPQKLALAIPTLCEAGNLSALLDRVRVALDPLNVDYEILIVDDDSCDGTAEIVSTLAQQDPRIRLLVRKGQRGLSGAILHGWENTDAAIVGVMDADFQHPPELLPELTAAIASGCDLVIGSRYTPGGGLGDWNVFRKLLSAAAVWATWPIQRLGLRAKDPMSGFFFVRRDCLDGDRVSAGRLQVAAGNSGARAHLIDSRNSVCLRPALPRREQGQYEGCSRLRPPACAALSQQIRVESSGTGEHFRLSGSDLPDQSAGNAQRITRNPTTPRKNTSAMRMPGSRLTSGTRSLAPT